MRPQVSLLLLAAVAGLALAELEPDDASKHLKELGLDGVTVPSVEQGQKAFEEQCRKHGGEDAVEKGKHAQQEMMECVQSLINVTVVQEEIEKAKPVGELDTVFKKYCKKTPDLMTCTTKLTTNIEGCLAEDQKKVSGIVLEVASTLLNFTCFKEGDRIALFIAEGGPECLESKQEGIQKCLNDTFGKYADSIATTNLTDISNFNLPLVLFDERQCNEIDEAAHCVVRVLEGCKDPTPANVVESVLKVVKKVIPCKSENDKQLQQSSVVSNKISKSGAGLLAALPLPLLVALLATQRFLV